MKVLVILLFTITICNGQTIDDRIEDAVRKVIKEEAIDTETMEARFEAILRRVLNEKFPFSPVAALPTDSETTILPGPVSSLLKITRPINNYNAKMGEVVTVRLDTSQLPDIAEYKVYVDGILRDTDLKTFTPYSFPVSLGNRVIRVDAIHSDDIVFTSSINIKVE